MMKANLKNICVIALVLITLSSLVHPASGMIQANIIPPSPYAVYTGQTYSLTVGVQYNIPKEADKTYGPYNFWIESPPSQSGTQQLHGSGTTAFQLVLRAPSSPGVYTLGLKLLVQAAKQAPSIMDTATVTYEVIEPVKTDWDVEKVWIEPKSPGAGDQVTFHATIVLRSTTSTKPLTVEVACYLDKKYYGGGTLTFPPKPGTQDIAINKAWTAREGSHVLVFVVDPNQAHNDPTPLPNYNFKELRFTIEPYYAIVKTITTPSEVEEGQWFDVVATIEYRFPGTASLEVGHHLWNVTLPPAEPRLDSVTGSGTRDYTFRVRALVGPSEYVTPSPYADTWNLHGIVTVRFDRGSGWQTTTPGWSKAYDVTVRRPPYYAVIDSMTVEYLGVATGDETLGRIRITVDIRYLLPLETGLRLVVCRFYNSSVEAPVGTAITEIWRDEATIRLEESVERTTTYTYEYTFPISSIRSDMMYFTATLDYLAYGSWNRGDDGSAGASVPYTPPPASMSDYLASAIQRIIDWFKRLWNLALAREPQRHDVGLCRGLHRYYIGKPSIVEKNAIETAAWER